nr:MAG TPA_asm: hypothetical protein [Bacteriophage sp.]
MKGYGLCRERHCLWAVPLLILDFTIFSLFNAENPRCSVWSIGGFYFFQALMRIFPCGRFSFLSFV